MGNGASQSLRQGRHSDSRISARGREDPSDASNGRGNNTVSLRLSLYDFEPNEEPGKPRARSLTGADVSSIAAEFVNHQGLQALDEGREDHNSSAASLAAAATNNNEPSPRLHHEQEDHHYGGAYDTEHFDAETIEWKKGEALGAGSYGTVYLARDEQTGALMAVKEIVVADESDDDVRHASREVELLRSLRHPNIVTYLGSRVDQTTRKLHIFTEWVPGGNLEQNRKRFGGGECVVRRFARQILLGVAYLHARRVIHHDIKPTNLLVDQFGVVKLADFGSSRLLATSTLVNNESMRGTPNYMAPEVIKQSGLRCVASDIWSVGCSVLRLLTGKPLWGDTRFDSQIALLYYIAHMERLPPLPETLSQDARAFLLLCLEIDPTRRPSAEQLLTHPFVGGGGSASGSFMLPSRSTLMPLQPHRDPPVMRRSTAPAEPHHVETPVLDVRPPPGSAPSPVASKSQLVSTRFPSRGLFDEPPSKPGETDDEEEENPEVVSLSVRAKASLPHRPLGRAAVSILSATAGCEDDASDVYTFSEFAETVVTTPRHATTTQRATTAASTTSTWEDQPILTDAARLERERQLTKTADDKRKKEDRDRQFQEELVEFRRSLAVQQR